MPAQASDRSAGPQEESRGGVEKQRVKVAQMKRRAKDDEGRTFEKPQKGEKRAGKVSVGTNDVYAVGKFLFAAHAL